MVTAHIFGELVGTGADGSCQVAFIAHFVKVGLAGNAAQPGSYAVGESGIGAGQGHGYGVVVNDVALFKVDEQCGADGSLIAVVEGELHIFGGQFLTVVEFHALTDVEGVYQAVIGHFIAFGQTGGQGAVCFQPEQAVIHVGQHQVVVTAATLLGLSEEAHRLAGGGQHQRILCFIGKGHRQAGQAHSKCQNEGQDFLHSSLLVYMSRG